MHGCGSPRLTSGVFLDGSPLFPLRQDLSIEFRSGDKIIRSCLGMASSFPWEFPVLSLQTLKGQESHHASGTFL